MSALIQIAVAGLFRESLSQKVERIIAATIVPRLEVKILGNVSVGILDVRNR
jgi:hypothetical protein